MSPLNLTAKVVPYSSVVGSGVMLIDKEGRAAGQLAILNTTSKDDDFETAEAKQIAVAEFVASRINQFYVGQPVKVSPGCDYIADYRGVDMWIAGVAADLKTAEITYTTSCTWPPESNGDLADRWPAVDLIARDVEQGGAR